MKKLLLILFFPLIVNGQTGGNMVNFFRYSTQSDWANFISASGETFDFRFRWDKRDSDLDKDRLIEFCQMAEDSGKNVRVIFTCGFDGNDAETIRFLELMGVWVAFVELGNEEYSQTVPKLNFENYRSYFEPVTNELGSQYFYLLCAPPRPLNSSIAGGRADHQNWHNALKSYIAGKDNYGLSWHIYFNNKESSVLMSKPAKRAYNPAQFDSGLNQYYSDLWSQCVSSNLWEHTLAYIATNYPDRKVVVDEFGIVSEGDGETSGGCGSIKNTLAYAMVMYKVWQEHKNDFESMAIHSGIGLVGMITPTGKYDLGTGGQKRVEFYAYELLNRFDAIPAQDLTISRSGTTYLWFTSYNGVAPVITFQGVTAQVKTYYVSGENIYSTAGYSEWQGAGTIKNREINGINEASGIFMPRYGFGVIEIKTTLIDVYGCTDPRALNYDAEANKENTPSTCYYQSDCACKDIAADNEDLSAPCTDNTLCTYPPQECWKERKIFKFLGCKSDPRCEYNNCNPQ